MHGVQNTEELLAKLASLESENRTLRNKQNKMGLTFKRYPEVGDAQFLRDGMMPYLERVDKYSVVKEDPQNSDHLLIEGDNLPALVTLQSTHKGKVDVIYIDPPYNTGNNDFRYNDQYVSNEDGFRHSKWLSFMERRLKQAKELLSDTGVIFVSIDDHEQAALKMLMDDVFGAANFVSNAIKQTKSGGGNQSKFFAIEHEYCLVYANDVSKLAHFHEDFSPEYLKRYKFQDERGMFYWDTFSRGVTKSNKYKIETPDGSYVEGTWLRKKEVFEQMLKDGTATITKRNNGWSVQFKQYLNASGRKPRTLKNDWGVSRDGTDEITSILGKGYFTFPKSSRFIKSLISLHPNPSAIVLDFFAGSGTTGHAVAALNAEDGGNRQAILVTNNFEQDGSENKIASDVTAARMKAVLTGEWADGKSHDALPGNLHYYRIDYKTPSFSGSTNARSMQSKFRGLAALATGSHLPVGLGEVPASAKNLREFIQEGSCALLRGPETLVVMWQDYSLLVLGEENSDRDCVQLVLDEVEEINASLEVPLGLVAYLPFNTVDISDEFDFQNWKLASFPERYFQDVTRVVESMIESDMLPETETIDDSLGGEGGPPVEPVEDLEYKSLEGEDSNNEEDIDEPRKAAPRPVSDDN